MESRQQKQNPIINWKAIDENGAVITSASTKITISETEDDNLGLGESNMVGIKDDSMFRFIPEQPPSNSDFRVIGKILFQNSLLISILEVILIKQ